MSSQVKTGLVEIDHPELSWEPWSIGKEAAASLHRTRVRSPTRYDSHSGEPILERASGSGPREVYFRLTLPNAKEEPVAGIVLMTIAETAILVSQENGEDDVYRESSDSILLEKLWVRDDLRGKGIARSLLGCAEVLTGYLGKTSILLRPFPFDLSNYGRNMAGLAKLYIAAGYYDLGIYWCKELQVGGAEVASPPADA